MEERRRSGRGGEKSWQDLFVTTNPLFVIDWSREDNIDLTL